MFVDHSEQLPDNIFTCDVNRDYYVLLLFLFVLLLFAFVCFIFLFHCFFLFSFYLFFLWDSNMISISAVEFRYYVAIIILVNLGKP